MMDQPKVLLLTRRDAWCDCAAALVRSVFPARTSVVQSEKTEGLAAIEHAIVHEKPDILLSFRCNTVLPARLFDGVDLALNFHPGSPEYPGSGCYNFALYDQAPAYGCVCHHMAAAVDTGSIVSVRRFPIFDQDSVHSLQMRTMTAMLDLMREVLDYLSQGKQLPVSSCHWQRKPYTRSDFEQLRQVDTTMTTTEIARRTRAVTYPGYPGVEFVRG